jgi:hypothetical protein
VVLHERRWSAIILPGLLYGRPVCVQLREAAVIPYPVPIAGMAPTARVRMSLRGGA